MLGIGFAAGFATGWASRSTVDASRGAVVRIVATCIAFGKWAQRAVATERENLEDLLAEARDLARSREATAVARRDESGSQVAGMAEEYESDHNIPVAADSSPRERAA